MAFPFVAPIDPWIVDVLKGRENNRHLTTFKNPYAILISTAKVFKGKPQDTTTDRMDEFRKSLKSIYSSISYNGCILANSGDTDITKHLQLKYSSNQTMIGIDFNGRPITVVGETGRMVPPPMIESIDIDTDGSNNTLKEARIAVRCFTLKQLEMFELFYMKPSMGVLLEFGDSSLLNSQFLNNIGGNPNQLRSVKFNQIKFYKNGKPKDSAPFNTINECLFYNRHKTFEDFCKQFTQIQEVSTDSYESYNETVVKSLGSYDRVAGYIMDYSFSIEEDGTYLTNLTLTQANQFSLAVPMAGTKSSSYTTTPDSKLSNLDKIKNKIIDDFKLDSQRFNELISTHPLDNGNWENDFFNFQPNSEKSKDDVTSKTPYVSLRFILSILLNYNNVVNSPNLFTFNLPTYEVDGKLLNVIPVQSNKYMISSTDALIYPTNTLPKFTATSTLSDTINSSITLSPSTIDGRINGYNFHMGNAKTVIDTISGTDLKTAEQDNENYKLADACNIFLNYEVVYKIWNDSAYKSDFINKVLTLINKNSYGMIGLQIASQFEGSSPTTIDFKLINSPFREAVTQIEPYRFLVGSINSNVKSFTFNYEMSDLVAASTLFDAQNFLNKLKDEDSGFYDNPIEDDKILQKADLSAFANADGFYSMNYSAFLNTQLAKEKERKRRAKGLETVSADEPENQSDPLKRETILTVIGNKEIKFKTRPTSQSQTALIYVDEDFVNTIINRSTNGIDVYTGESTASDKKQAPTLTNIDITLVIDGISGLRCGHCFRVSGIPEIYNQIGVFQITNIKHSITKDAGWETTIEASYTIRNLN